MKLRFPSTGLYVITQTKGLSQQQIVDSVAGAIRGGAKAIQYRHKFKNHGSEILRQMLSICHRANVPFIINDDIHLAKLVGADGVHLGKDDEDVETAKSILDNGSIIGVSCYNSTNRAMRAINQGADYVAFGRFFPSKSKPGASLAEIEVLHKARYKVPVVAIGGITPQSGKVLLDAGANVLAVIEAVCGQRDPERAAKRFISLF